MHTVKHVPTSGADGQLNRRRIIVLISGSGTNLQAILDACHDGRLYSEVVLVVSNRKSAFGLVRATNAGIPTLYFPLKAYRDTGRTREDYEVELANRLSSYEPDLIVLAGWMHVFCAAFLVPFANKVINLHPALPDTFPGTDAIERAYESWTAGRIAYTGCMVHHVVPQVDAGPVIAQSIVSFEENESLSDFAARMHQAEHELIVEATRKALVAIER